MVSLQIENNVEGKLYKVWCALHQLALKVQKAVRKIEDDSFIDSLNSLIGLLRQKFAKDLKTLCPRFVSTRWLSLHKVTSWILRNKTEVRSWLRERNDGQVLGGG